MMTLDQLRKEMRLSEEHEEKIYRELTLALFREIQDPLKSLYDQAITATDRFAGITADVLKAHPKIIKTLRYCMAPVISQMRLGQLIGLGTTEGFEEGGLLPTDDQGDHLARWFNDYLDKDRFPWLSQSDMSAAELGIATTYAKLWTISLQANQNTATKYRTQRKELQESAIARALDGIGLEHQERLGAPQLPPDRAAASGSPRPPRPKGLGGIHSATDIQPGHYVKEKKILGTSQKRQKSDLTARPTEDEQLFCIEAKAVGIKLDSTKRLKELNDKYTDWKGSSLPITTVGVIAGMFSEAELVATIKQRQIPIFFEHDLAKMVDYLRSNIYYGQVWNPSGLFPELPARELNAALEKIETAQPETEADPRA